MFRKTTLRPNQKLVMCNTLYKYKTVLFLQKLSVPLLTKTKKSIA